MAQLLEVQAYPDILRPESQSQAAVLMNKRDQADRGVEDFYAAFLFLEIVKCEHIERTVAVLDPVEFFE